MDYCTSAPCLQTWPGRPCPLWLVYPLSGQWQYPFSLYLGGHALTTTLPIIPDLSAAPLSSRLQAIAEKIRLPRAVASMKGLRVLCITDRPILGEYEPTASQTAAEGRAEYEKQYLKNLADLGAGIVVRPQQEMVSKLGAIPEDQASETASSWIAQSEGMKGTNEAEVTKSAGLYVVMKKMMHEHDADDFTTEGYGVFMRHQSEPIPSQGLPSSQLCTDGMVATSEALVDSLVTQQYGLWITGSTGFNGDYIVDTDNHTVYIGHCECTLDPYGDGRGTPYFVRNLPQSRWTSRKRAGRACR